MLAWLTPDVADFSDSQIERSIVLPGNLFFLVTGAISQLAESHNWEQFGDATPDEAAEFFQVVLEEYLMSDFRNVGMIAAFITTAAIPPRWLALSGQTVAQADYPELAAKVPPAWLSGSNIILKDARQRFIAGASSLINEGVTGGANTHTLTISEMPSHNHTTLGTNIRQAGTGANLNESIGAGTSGNAGLGNPHNNMPAYLTARWAIYAGR